MYNEIKDFLIPSCIPKQAGSNNGLRCKPVKRKYAVACFHDCSLVRTHTSTHTFHVTTAPS